MYYSALLGQWNGLANGVFDLDSDLILISAHTNTYTPNLDTHAWFSDATNEVTGTNYTAGGAILLGRTVSINAGILTFDADDVIWQRSATGFSNARKFIIYRWTGVAATSRLLSVITLDTDVGNTNYDLCLSGG